MHVHTYAYEHAHTQDVNTERKKERYILTHMQHTCMHACMHTSSRMKSWLCACKLIPVQTHVQVGFPVMLISVSVANVYIFILNAAFWQSTAGDGGGLRTNAQLAAGL